MLPTTFERLEKIKALLEENKEGLWMAKIVQITKIPEGSIRYLILGQTKNKRFYGGYLKDQIETTREGRNLKIRAIK